MGASRGRWFAVLSALGVKRGFFIPYRHAHQVATPSGYPALEPIFAAARPRFEDGLASIARHLPVLRGFGAEAPPAPRWNQSWFPWLDAAFAYAFVRDRAPPRIVEIGSGHSTRFMARAIEDGGLSTRLDCIDPAPRAALDGLAVRWTRARLEESGYPFAELGAGDVVFVDSSHILMPGTDLDFLFGDVLPRLAPGVILHFHDVFLPGAYPPAWAWRGYNEQNAVAALLASRAYAPLWSSAYVETRMGDALAARGLDSLPRPDGAPVSSLWLQSR
ncbi:MAG: class I SAM-dependent methyltransferase [Tagaea sp.]